MNCLSIFIVGIYDEVSKFSDFFLSMYLHDQFKRRKFYETSRLASAFRNA